MMLFIYMIQEFIQAFFAVTAILIKIVFSTIALSPQQSVLLHFRKSGTLLLNLKTNPRIKEMDKNHHSWKLGKTKEAPS